MTEHPPAADLLASIDEILNRIGREKDFLPGELRYTSNWRGSPLQMLPLGSRGLYSEMLTQAWATRGRLEMTAEDEIMRLVRAMPEEWAVAWPRIRHYWSAVADPETGAEVLVNRKQLEVYLGALKAREVTLTRNKKANAASVAARKAAKEAVKPVAATASPEPAPKAGRVPPCPECGSMLKRMGRSTSLGGMAFPPRWWCAEGRHSFVSNDPRIYGKLSKAARESIDHEVAEYDRQKPLNRPPASAPTAATTPPGPSALERSRPA